MLIVDLTFHLLIYRLVSDGGSLGRRWSVQRWASASCFFFLYRCTSCRSLQDVDMHFRKAPACCCVSTTAVFVIAKFMKRKKLVTKFHVRLLPNGKTFSIRRLRTRRLKHVVVSAWMDAKSLQRKQTSELSFRRHVWVAKQTAAGQKSESWFLAWRCEFSYLPT